METLNETPKLERDDLVAEHDALNAMYTTDVAAGTLKPEDVDTYVELVTENREQLRPKPLVVEFKNSGPQEIPVSRKMGGRAVDDTYMQTAHNDHWGVNNH